MTGLLLKLGALLAIFACVFLLVQQIALAVSNVRLERREVNRRLTLLRQGLSREQVVNVIRRAPRLSGKNTWLSNLQDRFAHLHSVSATRFSPSQTLVFATLAVIGIFLILVLTTAAMSYEVTVGRIALLAAFSIALGYGIPLMVLTRRADKRVKLMEEQFPVALDIFVRALRSGHPVSAAIDLLTREMPDPIGSEFGLVFDEVSYGSDFNTAVHNLAERWNLPDLHMFAVSLTVQSETGGNLAEILSNLSQTIRDRASLYLKVRALSAEGRMTAWMLTIMPVLTFLLLFMINPGFFLNVADDPIFIYGLGFLIILYFVGVIWLRKLVDLKV